ncbi:DEAD/DEAH box helicase family protein [Flavobacterium soyae]|uniref:DEAD/DEAH box helicase family protein n=1 Tax=Flavobacterium soyae TaxID=2903098 RepID=A0ABZ2UKG9_9FLAO
MINFKKRLEGVKADLKINPIEIYDTLDRASDKGPLRPSQNEILKEWFNSRQEQRDHIIKLHTGQGKTLIGLLILQSRINSGKGACIYVCPNIYLVEQTCNQAKQFGIPFCVYGEDKILPQEFINGDKILIIHSQLIFNGKTKFGLKTKSLKLDSIVLDDSHSCIDTIEDSFTVKVSREDNNEIYDEIFNLLETLLEDQGYAKLYEIKDGDREQVLSVPYWIWRNKFKDITDVLSHHKDEEKSSYKFAWDLIKDNIEDCFCLISGDKIEIKPYRNPIEKYGSFYNANCRIFMSATTNNDSFFIKGLGLKKETILNPIVFNNNLWSGEKMILFPYHMDDRLTRNEVITLFSGNDPKRKLGIIGLTTGFSRTNTWKNAGATVITSKNIKEKVGRLLDGHFDETLVFANRYDGIDLPDSSCRVLIIDSKPFSETLYDKYQEEVRLDSDVIDVKIAQKIEQGLGRGVRGEKDFCVILLIGNDILNVVSNDRYRKFFSEQTQMQIKIGLQVTKFAVEDAENDDAQNLLINTINQCLKRDENWKDFYKQEMDSIKKSHKNQEILEILEIERDSEEAYSSGQYLVAQGLIQSILDNYVDKFNITERGWYLQQIARFLFPKNSIDSNKFQINAHRNNRSLYKPNNGMEITRLTINEDRIEKIKKWIKQCNGFIDLKYKLDALLGDFLFGSNADKFEQSLELLGECLGFESERPEKYWKEGPDNLWCIAKGKYLLFECKNEVDENRAEIYKKESGQMANSIHWFEKNYPKMDLTPIMIINTRKLSKDASCDKRVKIMKKNKVNLFHRNIKAFFNEFSSHDLETVTSSQITAMLAAHSLTTEHFLDDTYLDKFV